MFVIGIEIIRNRSILVARPFVPHTGIPVLKREQRVESGGVDGLIVWKTLSELLHLVHGGVARPYDGRMVTDLRVMRPGNAMSLQKL